MAQAARRLLWPLLVAVTLLLGSLSASAVGQTVEGLHGKAAKAVAAQIRAAGLRYPQADIFYGDLTGGGTNDAISFVYHDSGGSGPQLTTWVWRETKSAYTLARTVPIDELFGVDPRDVRFSPGRIEVTTSVLQAHDPRCCPSGERTFMLEVGASGAPEIGAAASQGTTQVLDVPFADTGGDGQAAWCASSTVTGLNPAGDGFLAVRTGPGAHYRKIDQIYNGDVVSTCDSRGPWVAIVYGSSKKKGWVHGRWLKPLAG